MATGGPNNNARPQELTEKERKLMEKLNDVEKLTTGVNKAAAAAGSMQSNVQKGAQTLGKIGGDVGAIVSDIKKKTSAAAGTYGSNSLIGKASSNVFEFPVFMSSSIPIDFATATNSLLEQIYASYLQMAISQTPLVSASDAKSGNMFKNMKSDTTKYLEYTDMFYAHDACHNIIETDEAIVEFHMIDIPDDVNKVIMEQLDYVPLSEFDHFFQEAGGNNKYKGLKNRIDKDRQRKIDERAEARELREKNKALREREKNEREREKHRKDEEDRETKRRYDDQRELRERNKALFDYEKNARDAAKFQRDEEDRATKRTRDANEEERRQELHDKQTVNLDDQLGLVGGTTRRERDEVRAAEKHADDIGRKAEKDAFGQELKDKDGNVIMTTRKERQEKREEQEFNSRSKYERERHAADMKAKAPQMLDETKIQKLNTMKPLMMTVGVKVMADDGSYVSDMIDYVVGVKTHCRVVPADVLPDVAEYPNKSVNLLTRRARWRAGEIKFMDYLFSRKEKKQAAYDSKDPNRKWYHRLYTLAHSKGSNRVAKKITGKTNENGLIPNATLVMTKADVDMIEATNGIDLLKGSEAASLCREMFLIAMVVIDTDAQSIKILLPDVDNDYEVHSLASVNKQLATLDTSNAVSREVTKMMHGR